LHLNNSFFVTRAKSNFRFKRIYSHPVDRNTGVICDQTINLAGFYPSQEYPDKLRPIKYYDIQTNKSLVFLTNNFQLKTLLIAKIFKERWQIELFFKWIKQHLRIKSFYGTSENENSDMDCCLSLFTCGNCKKEIKNKSVTLHFSTDFKYLNFWKKTDFTAYKWYCLQN